MTGSAWLDTLIILLVVGLPVAAVLWFLRRPIDRGVVPRDIFASKAKGNAFGPGLFGWPTRAYRSTLIDQADDASHGAVDEPDDALDSDSHELVDTLEHRAQVIDNLKGGK
jgi:hypothetical protein